MLGIALCIALCTTGTLCVVSVFYMGLTLDHYGLLCLARVLLVRSSHRRSRLVGVYIRQVAL